MSDARQGAENLRATLHSLQGAVDAMRALHQLLLDRMSFVEEGGEIGTDREPLRRTEELRDEVQRNLAALNVEAKSGCSDEVIRGLKTYSVCTRQQRALIGDCVICQDTETTQGSIEFMELPCTHRFCSNCVIPWLRISNSCPICRSSVDCPRGGCASYTGLSIARRPLRPGTAGTAPLQRLVLPSDNRPVNAASSGPRPGTASLGQTYTRLGRPQSSSSHRLSLQRMTSPTASRDRKVEGPEIVGGRSLQLSQRPASASRHTVPLPQGSLPTPIVRHASRIGLPPRPTVVPRETEASSIRRSTSTITTESRRARRPNSGLSSLSRVLLAASLRQVEFPNTAPPLRVASAQRRK